MIAQGRSDVAADHGREEFCLLLLLLRPTNGYLTILYILPQSVYGTLLSTVPQFVIVGGQHY